VNRASSPISSLTLWLSLVAILMIPSLAAAYPQFTMSRAATCSSCHVSPAGGGLLDGMGPITAEDDTSFGGDAGFAEGKVTLPDWLKLGGDVRNAAGAINNGGGLSGAAFPMQLETYAAVTKDAFTGYVTLGLVRPNETSIASIIQTREHWLMWRPHQEGLYVRAGRFMPVYGLRLAEHTFYVRRFGGAPLYGETYGASVGWVNDSFEAHLTGFVSDPIRTPLERGNGAALYAEKRLTGELAVGAQARYANSDNDTRTHGGLTAKYWLEPASLLLQAEGSLVRQSFEQGPSRTQFAGQLLASWFFKTGFMLDAGLGQYDADLSLKNQARTAFDVNLHWFPYAHGELVLMTRLQSIGLGNGGDTSGFALLQLHYRL
jgi:hypothetical protein